MPIYFFQMAGHVAPDPEGYDLPDLETARRVAVRTACAIIGQSVEEFWGQREWVMTVTDDAGLALFSLTFFATDAAVVAPVEIHIQPPPKV